MAPTSVAPASKAEQDYWFDNGFEQLHQQIGSIMGRAVEPEHGTDEAGEVVQRTSTGLAVWKPGSVPRFTDGWRTWAVEAPVTQEVASISAPHVGYSVWDRLAACESGGNWASRTNPIYKGGVQMDSTFWARYGGLAFAARADYATREQQILVAQRGLAVQGWLAWPTCSRIIGLR